MSADLTPLLPSIEAVDSLAPETLPAIALHLTALLGRVTARMACTPPTNGTGEDHLFTVEEAAEQLRTTPDWLGRHGDRLPFVVRLSPGQVRYSAKGIERWIASRMRARGAPC